MKNFVPLLSNKIKSLQRRTTVILFIAAGLLTCFYFSLPSKLFSSPTSFVLEDKEGNLLSASIAADGQWRFPFDECVPEKFIKCLITFEDKRFYHHPGVDVLAIGRAISKNIQRRKIVQGGSTLTMQVIRLSRHNPKRNLWQKVIESIQALRLECGYSKTEIIGMYAANAPFGGNVVGLGAASWRYFGRSPDKLSWGELASLAVLPNSPALVHPGKNRRMLLKKRNDLLDKLFVNNTIDSTTCSLAKLEPLPGKPLTLPQFAPHLLQRCKARCKKSTDSPVTIVKSTIDLRLQKRVIAIIDQHHKVLKGNGINNACALVVAVETGNVLAYVGNISATEDAEMESSVDVIKAPRSPGSALKPLLYSAMLSSGMILPNSIIPDVPTQIGGYAPQNFDLTYDGAVPASVALARSLNIPAVKLLLQYKYQQFYQLLKRCGITTLNRPADTYGLSLILGGCEVTMWDLAGAYASLARTLNHQNKNNGIALSKDFHPPKYEMSGQQSAISGHKSAVSSQQLAIGNSLANSLDATSIWFTFQAMEEVMRPGEEGLWQQFSSAQKIAWKTGTSFGFRDGWAFGVTPKYVVAVWVGNTDGEGRPGLIGVQTAAPIMFEIFRQLPVAAWFNQPLNNFIYVPVCRQSGYKANIDCPEADTLMVSKNGDRAPLCSYHKIIHLDATGTYRVNENCESMATMQHSKWFVLPPAMEWYYKQKNQDYKPLPPYKRGCAAQETGKYMELIYPQQNARIYVPLEINGQRGKTIFTAVHRNSNSKIFWSLDDKFILTTDGFHQVAISPSPGKHTLTLVAENGEVVTRLFEILQNTNEEQQ